MRLFLCLALFAMMGVLLFSTGTRPVSGCTDYDQDGVCPPADCNDFNPTISYDGDFDNDGVTVCQGDCMDDDPTILKCKESHKQYPIFYNPPEENCTSGFTVTTQLFHCWTQPDGSLLCETTPFYQYDTNYLRNCY
jgi:hypothetical protein